MDGHSLFEIILFVVLVSACLWIDLHAHDKDEPVSARSAALWSVTWISLALAFAGYIGWKEGHGHAELFLAGYLLEESLSVDNLFVMMAIFSSFGVREEFQHRVLFYGILGAVVMRLLFVAAGSSLIMLFGPYAMTAFGLFVLWTAWKMFQTIGEEEKNDIDYSRHWAVRWTQKFMPVHPHLHGHDFFVREPHNGGKERWKATPLFLCLVVIEISDVLFAVDSVPAVLSITPDPFLVYTSNIFAILGLRSMYFLLAAAARHLRHLKVSVIAILAFVGIKMLLDVAGIIHLPAMASLGAIAGFLTLGILASFLPEKKA